MEGAKRHKRSGSTAAKPSSFPSFPRKKSNLAQVHGKFQVGKAKVEKKNIDADLNSIISTLPSLATATPVLLNRYSAGTGPTETLGRRVTNLSLLVRMNVTASVAINTQMAPTVVRVLVVYDRQPSNAAPSVANILGGTTYGVSSPLNLAFSDRFSVIMDEKQPLGGLFATGTATNAFGEVPKPVLIDRYVKLKLPTVSSSSFGGTVATIAEGGIYMLAFSDIAAANNPPTVTSGVSRIRFVDD